MWPTVRVLPTFDTGMRVLCVRNCGDVHNFGASEVSRSEIARIPDVAHGGFVCGEGGIGFGGSAPQACGGMSSPQTKP